MMFGEDQIVFWEGPNCAKKTILSMQGHRHNVKTLHCLKLGLNHGFKTFRGRHGNLPP